MTTTYADIETAMTGTLGDSEVIWKAYGTGAFRSTYFIRFGTPATYSRANVRAIAERIFERHPARPSLQAIRRDDKGHKGPWVSSGQFWSNDTVGEHYGFQEAK